MNYQVHQEKVDTLIKIYNEYISFILKNSTENVSVRLELLTYILNKCDKRTLVSASWDLTKGGDFSKFKKSEIVQHLIERVDVNSPWFKDFNFSK